MIRVLTTIVARPMTNEYVSVPKNFGSLNVFAKAAPYGLARSENSSVAISGRKKYRIAAMKTIQETPFPTENARRRRGGLAPWIDGIVSGARAPTLGPAVIAASAPNVAGRSSTGGSSRP